MKLICDCGNEAEFMEEHESIEGIYVDIDFKKFNFHSEHDQVWIGCKKCNKGVWFFT